MQKGTKKNSAAYALYLAKLCRFLLVPKIATISLKMLFLPLLFQFWNNGGVLWL